MHKARVARRPAKRGHYVSKTQSSSSSVLETADLFASDSTDLGRERLRISEWRQWLNYLSRVSKSL